MSEATDRAVLLAANPPGRANYDMDDTEEEILKLHPVLGNTLSKCRDIVFKPYERSDASAMRNQKYHRALTVLASAFGTLAILFAIAQLSGFFPSPWPMFVEATAAATAFLAVLIGLVQARQVRWLLERYKAERMRLIKFRSLLDPGLWSGEASKAATWEEGLKREVNEVTALAPKSLRVLVERHTTAGPPPGLEHCRVADDALKSLVSYYRDKRISYQMRYFKRQADHYHGIDSFMRNIPPIFFFLSVLAALGHFSIDLFFRPGPAVHSFSIVLIVMAASLPVIGAGIRTVRSAHEFSRSASLFRAKHTALGDIAGRLDAADGCGEALLLMWQCEDFLEGEHIEWLRLVSEAEWFG